MDSKHRFYFFRRLRYENIVEIVIVVRSRNVKIVMVMRESNTLVGSCNAKTAVRLKRL